uniref:Uncharacterized protein n=1 Tax=Oryza glumipatula TaxID=40148 RepID=A0A0E0B5M9_9ORYZ
MDSACSSSTSASKREDVAELTGMKEMDSPGPTGRFPTSGVGHELDTDAKQNRESRRGREAVLTGVQGGWGLGEGRMPGSERATALHGATTRQRRREGRRQRLHGGAQQRRESGKAEGGQAQAGARGGAPLRSRPSGDGAAAVGLRVRAAWEVRAGMLPGFATASAPARSGADRIRIGRLRAQSERRSRVNPPSLHLHQAARSTATDGMRTGRPRLVERRNAVEAEQRWRR